MTKIPVGSVGTSVSEIKVKQDNKIIPLLVQLVRDGGLRRCPQMVKTKLISLVCSCIYNQAKQNLWLKQNLSNTNWKHTRKRINPVGNTTVSITDWKNWPRSTPAFADKVEPQLLLHNSADLITMEVLIRLKAFQTVHRFTVGSNRINNVAKYANVRYLGARNNVDNLLLYESLIYTTEISGTSYEKIISP